MANLLKFEIQALTSFDYGNLAALFTETLKKTCLNH